MLRSRISMIALTVASAITGTAALPTSSGAAPMKTSAATRASAAKFAAKQVGDPYRLGAVGPNAFDCSGLVDFAFRAAGTSLGVRTSQDMARLGAHIRRAAIRPGDLIFTWSRGFGHVGMAVSATRYVHAPAPGRRVTIAPIPAGAGLVAVRRP